MKVKTILHTLCICIFLLAVSCKNETTDKTSFLEGFTEMSETEMQTANVVLEDITFYDPEGNTLAIEQVKEFLNQGSYPKLYKDTEGKVSLGILAPPTEEQKEEMAKMMKQFEMEAAKLQESVGQLFPKFDLVDYEGKEVKSNDLQGKITVVNFWFKECKPCIIEMPELNELVEDYKDNSNVQFIGFSTTAKDRLPSFFEKHDFDYRIVPDSQTFAISNNISSFPTNIVVDQEGNIKFIRTGYTSGIADTIKEEIESLL